MGTGDQRRPPPLEASAVSVHFGGLRALDRVSFTVDAGETVALVGPNGAGKTTLLNAASGFVAMDGSITVAGTMIRGLRPHLTASLRVGRSFQSPQLLEAEDAVENALCGGHLRAGYLGIQQILSPRRVARRERSLADEARALLVSAGLTHREVTRPAGQLTHGARKRVDIVRAIMSDPQLVLLDEPTAGMGSEERAQVEEFIANIRKRPGVAVVMVEHHMEVVRRVADRVIAMHMGAVLADGRTAEVLGSEEFITASLGVAADGKRPDGSN